MDNLNNLCDGFTNLTVCALSYTNLYNLKLIVIGVIALFSIYFLIYTKQMLVISTFDYYKRGALKYPSMVYLAFLPLFFILLRHSINFETFLIFIIGGYLSVLGLFVAGALLFGVNSGSEMVFGTEHTTLTEKWKYRRSKDG